jgi:predicted DNA-binding transcriptional regulator AlpA
MSGLSRTPGKRVRVNSPPRVRIPPSPPGHEIPCGFPADPTAIPNIPPHLTDVGHPKSLALTCDGEVAVAARHDAGGGYSTSCTISSIRGERRIIAAVFMGVPRCSGSDPHDTIRQMSDPASTSPGPYLVIAPRDLEALARHIAARIDPLALLDAEDVGALLKCCPRQVTERYAKTSGFPKPVPLALEPGARSRPRWQREDIAAWIASRKLAERKPGRPRKPVEW